MWVTETTFQPKRIADDKKVRSSANSLFECAGAAKPNQLPVQKIRFCNSGDEVRSRGRVARSLLERSRQTVER
jgi:hypothetical protein